MRTTMYNRNFSLLLIGQIITLFGSSILRFSLSLYILDLTGSAETFAALLAISTIPTVFLSPIGGAIADRLNKRNLMVIMDFISSVLVGVLAVYLFNGDQSIVLLGVVMTLLSVVSTFYQPTVQASIPLLVEMDHLLKANGVVSGVSAITNFAGPVLGGLLYGIWGIEPIILITCISFFLCAVTEMFIRIPYEKGKQTYGAVKTILYDLKDGAEYILKKNTLLSRIIIIAAAMNVFITPLFLVGIPYIIKIEMGMEDQFFGFTQGGISLSMIIAAVAIGAVASKLKISNLYVWFIVSGLFIIPMALSVHPLFMEPGNGGIFQYIVFSVCTMLVMFVITIINIYIMTMLQQQTPSLLLGKVLAILTAVSTCAVPVGQILFGSLLESFAGITYNLLFIVAFVTIVIAVATRWMLRTKSEEYNVEVDNAVL